MPVKIDVSQSHCEFLKRLNPNEFGGIAFIGCQVKDMWKVHSEAQALTNSPMYRNLDAECHCTLL